MTMYDPRGRWITDHLQLAEIAEIEGTVIDCADGIRRIFGRYRLWYRVIDGENPSPVGVNGYSVAYPVSVVPSEMTIIATSAFEGGLYAGALARAVAGDFVAGSQPLTDLLLKLQQQARIEGWTE